MKNSEKFVANHDQFDYFQSFRMHNSLLECHLLIEEKGRTDEHGVDQFGKILQLGIEQVYSTKKIA